MNLPQAKRIAELAHHIKTDECTFAPEFGVGRYCIMHDVLLILFVGFTRKLNPSQIAYMLEQKLHSYVTWAESKGRYGTPLTWKQVNHLFREGLQEKIHTEGAWYKKLGYWGVRNVYYFGVTLWRRVKR